MRFCLSFLLLFALFAAPSCKKRQVRREPFSVFVDVPAGLNVLLTHHFPANDIPGITGNLTKAQPAGVRLIPVMGEVNMNFVQNAFLDLIREDGTRVELAYMLNAPITNSQYMDLFPSIVDVREEVTAPDFDVELKLVFRNITTDITRIRIDFTIQVEEE